MPDLPPALSPKHAHELSQPRKWLTSASLILLTALVGIACVVVLSVTLTQTRVSTLDISIRKLDYVGRKWSDLLARIELRLDEIEAKEAKTDEFSANVMVHEAERAAKKKETDALLVGFYFRIQGVDEELAKRIHEQGHDTQVGHISAAKDRIVAEHPELLSIIESVEKSFLASQEAERQAISANANKQANLAAIAALNEQVNSAKTALNEQFKLIKPSLDPEARSRVESAFYELNINNFNWASETPVAGRLMGLSTVASISCLRCDPTFSRCY